MISKKIIFSTIGGMIALVSTNCFAAQMQVASNDVIAREASEGPRGADNHRGKHKLSIDMDKLIIAREVTEGPRGADNNNHRRGRGGRVG